MHYHVDRERLRGWRDALEGGRRAASTASSASAPGFDQTTGRLAGGKLLDRAEPPDRDRLRVRPARARRAPGRPRARRRRPAAALGRRLRRHARSGPRRPPTVRQPHQEKGAAALRLLLDPATPKASVLLPTELVPRSSTAPAPSRRCSPPETPTWTPSAPSTRSPARSAAPRSSTASAAQCDECARLQVHDSVYRTVPHTSGVKEIPLEQISATVEARPRAPVRRRLPPVRQAHPRALGAVVDGRAARRDHPADQRRPHPGWATPSSTATTACRSPAPAAR